MTLVSLDNLVVRVRDLLGDQPFTTTSTTTGTGATVAVPDGTLWSAGDTGEWQTGSVKYEQFYVHSINVNDLTVTRGYGGTTAESHTSGDAIVQNPSFYGRHVQQALAAACRSLLPYCYVVEDVTLDIGATAEASRPIWWELDVTSNQDIVGIQQVTQLMGTDPKFTIHRYGVRGGLPFEVDTQVLDPDTHGGPTTTGWGIRFPRGYYDASTSAQPIYVNCITPITGTSDVPDDVHFPVADHLVYAAAGRLVQATEIPRVAVGSDLETSSTVGQGARMQTGSFYTALGKQKLEELAERYRRYYRPVWGPR